MPATQTPNLTGMLSDPDFRALGAEDQRAALSRLTGDNSFSNLSDDETSQFISRASKQVSGTSSLRTPTLDELASGKLPPTSTALPKTPFPATPFSRLG